MWADKIVVLSTADYMPRMQQEEVTDKRRAERAEAFVPPKEDAAPTVEEKKKRKERAEDGEDGERPHKSKKKKKKATEGDY